MRKGDTKLCVTPSTELLVLLLLLSQEMCKELDCPGSVDSIPPRSQSNRKLMRSSTMKSRRSATRESSLAPLYIT